MKILEFLSVSSCLIVTGCAGTISAYKNRAVNVHDLNKNSIYTMTGDRRMAIITEKMNAQKFCAESMPDAAAALGASSSASLSKSGASVGMTDSAVESLLQTFQRTEIAEVNRQLGWMTCLAWAQGAIDDKQYHSFLSDLVRGGIEVMKTRASQTLVTQSQPSGTVTAQPTGVGTTTSSQATTVTSVAKEQKTTPVSPTAAAPARQIDE